MRTFSLFVAFSIILFTSCQKEKTDSGCVDDVVAQNDMVKYTGQELGCNTHLHLYLFHGVQYFVLDNNCADMVYAPFDCEGNEICGSDVVESICTDFYENREYAGIVGIRIDDTEIE